MGKSKIIIVSASLVVFVVLFAWLRSSLHLLPGLQHANPFVLQGIAVMVGMLAAGVMGWVMTQRFSSSQSAAPAAQAEGEDDLETLLEDAEARLSTAQLEKSATLSALPAIFLMGETGSAKTTSMVQSGLGPDLLGGHVYDENTLLPTPVANLWFAKRTVFVEAAGRLMGDAPTWATLSKRMRPARLAALIGKGSDAPRAALVCVDAETLILPGREDALAASARTLRTRLMELAQQFDVEMPVYVLFTKTDRLPFFGEYVRNLNNEEAVKTIGATLPIVSQRSGVYAEQETARLNGVFERLFRSLCNARPELLSREHDAALLPGIYEFPREFRKLRAPLVRFLVELCKPSQLNTGAFLRGFYFSGVRPIVVNEAAPAAVTPAESRQQEGRLGATGMFRMKAGSQPAAPAARVLGTRKVPQWLFLGRLFNDLLVADHVASSASRNRPKANLTQRILLATAAVLCLAYGVALTISFRHNRALESTVRQAAQGIAAVDAPAGANRASLDSLQRLETLRQSLETLTGYERSGPPKSYRLGLYVGDALYPEVRRLYFEDFRRLLWAPTEAVLLDFLRTLPPNGSEFPAYDNLKAYLITTSNHDKSTREFLAPLLLDRWSAGHDVDAARLQLARKQFEFYSDELRVENPYPSENDTAAVEKAREYLKQFTGVERIYQLMLAAAAKDNPAINFNKRIARSAETVVETQEVAGAFSKGGWTFMKTALNDPRQFANGEQWVLGAPASLDPNVAKLRKDLASRYYSDFLKQWRAYMKGASVVRYESFPDASKKLNALSGNQSPLLALMWLASQNTAVDAPDIANAFQPVQAVVPPSSVDRYIAPGNQNYMNALVTLQTSVEAVAAQPQGNDAAVQTLSTNATAARVAARQVAQGFRIDPEANMETTVQNLLEAPITATEALLRNLGPGELNGKGKGLCSALRSLESKYPFNPNASEQARIADIDGVFKKPDGALWKLYEGSLQKLMPKQGSRYAADPAASIKLRPQFVDFFNQAAALSDFLYAGGSQEPHITYALKPVPTDGIQAAGLELDGQTLSYSGGNAGTKQFVWQDSGAHGAKATVRFGGGPDLAWSTNEGLWAIFQFFGKAEQWHPAGNGYMLEWVIRIGKDPVTLAGKPLTVRFELDMGGGPQVFQKGYLGRLGCVAEIAK